MLSGLISPDVSNVKVNGQGGTVGLNVKILKGIGYRAVHEGEKDMMSAPGAITVAITVQYPNGESGQFTLPYCPHKDTLYIAPAQSIAPFARYLTGSPACAVP